LASWPHFCSGLTFVLCAPPSLYKPQCCLFCSVVQLLLLYRLLTKKFYYRCRIVCAARAHWPYDSQRVFPSLSSVFFARFQERLNIYTILFHSQLPLLSIKTNGRISNRPTLGKRLPLTKGSPTWDRGAWKRYCLHLRSCSLQTSSQLWYEKEQRSLDVSRGQQGSVRSVGLPSKSVLPAGSNRTSLVYAFMQKENKDKK